KIALEPVHVQFSYDDRSVATVNGTQSPQSGLKIVAKLYDVRGMEKYARDSQVDVVADGVTRAFTVPEPPEISSTYFLNLQLFSASGQLLSRNFYWLSTKADQLDFAKTEWYYTPQIEFADFSALQDLPKVAVRASLDRATGTEQDTAFQVVVENTGKSIAFLTRLRLVNDRDRSEILPAFWQDNYISLMPGERREITVNLRKSDLGGAQPELLVDGWNVPLASARMP
ncbi:MAG TPA: hypothetical protein VKB49_03970, partial [Candidatus Sulfotelmatobacter sp.]|nr:hypothetical protein [Candidatus Sulfotelmatobacter sp.]